MKHLDNIRNYLSLFFKIVDWSRRILVNLLFLILVALFLFGSMRSSKPKIDPNSVLLINPQGVLVEETQTADPTQALLRSLNRQAAKGGETRVQDIITAIQTAAGDSKIRMLLLDPQDLQGCDAPKLMEIGTAVRKFKETGKPVLAYASAYTQGQYLLASYADRIFVNPLGGVALTGYGMYQPFYKNLLDKTKVHFHVFRVGEYKSAVEPFVRDSMSPEARESMRDWLSQLWQNYQAEVGRNRNISPADITAYIENIDTSLKANAGNAAKTAVSAKLADEISSGDQFDILLANKLGVKPASLSKLDFRDYLHTLPEKKGKSRELVGVIRARGPIVPGSESESMIGSESMAQLFQEARDDASVVSVVLRIDSPGGSATAAEDIYREIIRTQDAGKPVVVSMGSVAASGGYWIATAANRILASPNTLTGSIGIFAAFPTFEETAQTLGITSDGLGTTSMSDLGNPLRPLSDKTKASIQYLLQFGYDTFIERVASGRRMAPADARQLANGRVWTGQEALQNKLIDQLGGMDDAIQVAAELAGLSKVESKDIRRSVSPREALLQDLFSSAVPRILSGSSVTRLLGQLEKQMSIFDTFTDPSHLYARSLECEAVFR